MKTLTKKQQALIESYEAKGDKFLEKETFDSCLSAVDNYIEAQRCLYEAVCETCMSADMLAHKRFSSDNTAYNAWYANLSSKIKKASAMTTDPKIFRK